MFSFSGRLRLHPDFKTSPFRALRIFLGNKDTPPPSPKVPVCLCDLSISLKRAFRPQLVSYLFIKGRQRWDNSSYLDNLLVIKDVEKVQQNFSQGSVLTLFILSSLFFFKNTCCKWSSSACVTRALRGCFVSVKATHNILISQKRSEGHSYLPPTWQLTINLLAFKHLLNENGY